MRVHPFLRVCASLRVRGTAREGWQEKQAESWVNGGRVQLPGAGLCHLQLLPPLFEARLPP